MQKKYISILSVIYLGEITMPVAKRLRPKSIKKTAGKKKVVKRKPAKKK
jgi:hypothetical protein